MPVESVKVRFDSAEYQALVRSCDTDMRPVDDQVRYVVVRELRRRGLLKNQTELSRRSGEEVSDVTGW
jgi:hypothetical protein